MKSESRGLKDWAEHRLLLWVRDMPGPFLPSQISLRRHLGISQSTLGSVLKRLVAQGTLSRLARGKFALSGREIPAGNSSSEKSKAAPDQVAEFILHQMRLGIFRSGQALPKVMSLTLELKVSTHSVHRACRQLAEKGYIWKNGKIWLAGPKPAHRLPPRERKVILILMAKPNTWNSIDAALRTRNFTIAFSRELQHSQARLHYVSVGQAINSGGTFAEQSGTVLSQVRQLGETYLGTLILEPLQQMPDLGSWIRELLLFGKPVVWLDKYDEGLTSDMHNGPFGGHPDFVRCRYNERAAVELALSHMSEAGHSRIGYLFHGPEGWMQKRGEVVHECAAAMIPRMEVKSHSGLELLYLVKDEKEATERLRRLHRCPNPRIRSLVDEAVEGFFGSRRSRRGPIEKDRDAAYAFLGREIVMQEKRLFLKNKPLEVLTHAELFQPFLSDPKLTALLLPNDIKATIYYRWLTKLGIAIPDDLSLLSFDNYAEDQPIFPINTVDFGFDYLGFAAFHAISKTIPIPRDRYGTVSARPHMVDRGSLAAPGAGKGLLAWRKHEAPISQL